MTTATKLKEKIFNKCESREKAIELCINHKNYVGKDFTEADSYEGTDIFFFKDDSELKIDTEGYVYEEGDSEIGIPSLWIWEMNQ